MSHNTLNDVHHDQGFTFRDGTHVLNIADLVEHLKKCSYDTFEHHLHDDGNDFFNWIHHVVDDRKLAERIQHIRSKDYMIRVLEDYVDEISQHHSQHQNEKNDSEPEVQEKTKTQEEDVKHVVVKQKRHRLHLGIEEFFLGLLIGFLIGIIVTGYF